MQARSSVIITRDCLFWNAFCAFLNVKESDEKSVSGERVRMFPFLLSLLIGKYSETLANQISPVNQSVHQLV